MLSRVVNDFKIIGKLLKYIYIFLIIFSHSDILQNAEDEAQGGIKIAGRNINNLRYADDTTLMAESEEELKKPLDESESGE